MNTEFPCASLSVPAGKSLNGALNVVLPIGVAAKVVIVATNRIKINCVVNVPFIHLKYLLEIGFEFINENVFHIEHVLVKNLDLQGGFTHFCGVIIWSPDFYHLIDNLRFRMDYSLFDDQTLLQLIINKDEQALGELYDRFGRLVYSISLNAIGETTIAEEITQDVFFRVWTKAFTYRSEHGKVVTWIAGITRNRAIDEIRRMKVRPESNLAPWDLANAEVTDEDSDVEVNVERSQQKHLVYQAIAQLPKEQQEALAYSYFRGYSHREIAEILNEPIGTIKTRILLAMKKVRSYLEHETDR